MAEPRNYHSVALLLKDGRVLASGGGLCVRVLCEPPNVRVFLATYLFDASGGLRERPTVIGMPSTVQNRSVLRCRHGSPGAAVQRHPPIIGHAFINTDQRLIQSMFNTLVPTATA